MYLLGFDIGSSSVKASLIDAATGNCLASAFFPEKEMEIMAPQAGWAEQHPHTWWENLKAATKTVLAQSRINAADIKGIGISYQMHGLVCVDKDMKVLRPSIIWCDSRAVSIGDAAFNALGTEKCLGRLLNSPGNFTASKLRWVKENEPEIFAKIHKIMLPGDYIALCLTGEAATTAQGLSEGIMWDFQNNAPAQFLLDYYGINPTLLPQIVPTFSVQGRVSAMAAAETGLAPGTPVCYRAGDQPNNAFSLNVLNPGEIAATAGTSGVVYGVSSEIKYDPRSRVNTFAHVNHTAQQNRLGVLLCINGTGILNSWLKKNIGFASESYDYINELTSEIAPGSDGLCLLPFGNGAERVLGNKNIGAQVCNLSFTRHTYKHLLRAAHEGIAFSFQYGIEIMKNIGIEPQTIRAGKANMFLSPVFRNTLAAISGAGIELYNTDGSLGAARAAGVGAGIYKSFNEAFVGFLKTDSIEPTEKLAAQCKLAYVQWKHCLENALNKQLM